MWPREAVEAQLAEELEKLDLQLQAVWKQLDQCADPKKRAKLEAQQSDLQDAISDLEMRLP